MKKYNYKNYLSYLRNNPKGYWFKRKLYGLGWVPVKWQGWIIVLMFLAIILLNGLYLELSVSSKGEPTALDLAVFFGIIILSITFLIWIGYKKGEKLKWSWGRN